MTALPKFDGAKILVVGDVMLDRYWFGDVSRISPEAPVPVLKVERVDERPGGAANVARNIAALGAHATLLSVVGNDEAGACLEKLLSEHHNLAALLHRDNTISTIIKLRAIARHQQLLRIDFETPPSHEVLHAALEDFRAQLPLARCGDPVRLWQGRIGAYSRNDPAGASGRTNRCWSIPRAMITRAIVVQPCLRRIAANFAKWREAGRHEAELNIKAEKLRTELQLDALLVTRSEEGMSLFRANEVLHEPTHTREVFDVSGAGDTVIATLAVMLASGAELPEADAHRQSCGRHRGRQAGDGGGHP